MTAKLRAIRDFFIAGKLIHEGDVFDINDQLASDLIAWRRAEPGDDKTRALVHTRPTTEWSEAPKNQIGPRPPFNWYFRQ